MDRRVTDEPTSPVTAALRVAAVVFDMDGVLLDTTPIHERAWAEMLAAHGVPIPGSVRDLLGRRGEDVLDELVADEERAEAMLADLYERTLDGLGRASGLVTEGAPELLDALRATGKLLALATSARSDAAEALLGRALLSRFDAVVAAEHVRRGKPHPDVYARAADALGVAPGDCVAVEDAVPGIRAAVAAGMHVVAVTGTATEGQLRAAGAVTVVRHPLEVAGIVA